MIDSNTLIISLLVVSEIILALIMLAEIKEIKLCKLMVKEHKKIHISLLVLALLIPNYAIVQIFKMNLLPLFIAKGGWISLFIYNTFALFLSIHLRDERKGLDNTKTPVTFFYIFKLILKSIKTLLR